MKINPITRRFAFASTLFLLVLSSKILLFPAKATEATAQSFVTGTSVWTESGPLAIEALKTGDRVWVEDEDHGQVELKAVTATSEQEVSATLLVSFTNGEHFETTAGHPIYVEGSGFKSADQLAVGDLIVTKAGPSQAIASIQHKSQLKTVRSFSVADCNTYFVGESGFWASN